jgi:NAD(P)-dependent dehydrogenase (short-subunit alcohol dehydrogenase family)
VKNSVTHRKDQDFPLNYRGLAVPYKSFTVRLPVVNIEYYLESDDPRSKAFFLIGSFLMTFRNRKYWALILGGSTGIGLATAKRLGAQGMNVFVVHRDRRAAMERIERDFDEIRGFGVEVRTFNGDALSQEGRNEILNCLADYLHDGKVRTILHSIALGNLKPLVEQPHTESNTLDKLAEHLGIDVQQIQEAVNQLATAGHHDLADLIPPSTVSQSIVAGEEDFAQTIFNMGTSLLFWVQDLHRRGMFAPDARVIGLTSEGNEIAWNSYAPVSAAKSALESVARAIAKEFAPFGIRCNVLQPGVTDTPALRLIPGSSKMKSQALKRNPFGRLTTPEDVANVVDLMSRDEAAWINGAILRVDGGEHISG